jgi:hypothetical protein
LILLNAKLNRRARKENRVNPNFPAHKLFARILAPLGTPARRAWFVVATLGLLLMLGGSAVFAIRTDYGRYGTDDFTRLVFDPEYFQYSGFRGSFGIRVFQLGLLMAIVGGVFAYWYDATLGAVGTWVRQGQGLHPSTSGGRRESAAPTGLLNRRKLTHSELSALAAAATSAIQDRWLVFTKTIHFKAEVPLADRISSFATLIQTHLNNSYPALSDLPAKMFWMMMFSAIEQSKTHAPADLNSAVAQLRDRFGPGQGEPQAPFDTKAADVPSTPSQSTASTSSAPARGAQPDTRRAMREAMLAAARYFEIDGQPAIVVDGANFGALRNQNGSWVEEQPAIIENKGRAITADEFAALRARDRDWGGHLADNLNLNVLLEDRGLIGPPP